MDHIDQLIPPDLPDDNPDLLPPISQIGINFAKAMVRHNHVIPKASAEIGISTNAGKKLYKSPVVREYIDQVQAEQAHRAKIDDDYILYKLQDIVEDSTEEGVLVRKVKGENGTIIEKVPTGQMKDASAACRALELLGKNRKMFTDRVEKESTHHVYVHAPARPSLEEWEASVKQASELKLRDDELVAIEEVEERPAEMVVINGEAVVEEEVVDFEGPDF